MEFGVVLTRRLADIVGQHVDRAEVRFHFGEGAFDLFAICHVARERQRAYALGPDEIGGFGQRICLPVEDGDVRALFCERDGNGAADAVGAARHDGDLSLKLLRHGGPFPRWR